MILSDEKTGNEPEPIRGIDIPEVELLPLIKPISQTIRSTIEYFFTNRIDPTKVPFRGFILLGDVGTGKTETIKQTVRYIDRRLQKHGNIYTSLLLVDGAHIAAPRWGEAEKNLKRVFQHAYKMINARGNIESKMIILFDDIESLVLKRGENIAKEWHYSINSIMFHELDAIDPSKVIVCATTNKPELVDDAILTRLFPITFSHVPIEDLMVKVKGILEATNVNDENQERIIIAIREKLLNIKNASIRDAQHHTVVECINQEVWK